MSVVALCALGQDVATLAGLKLRWVGPALMSGCIESIAVHPKYRNTVWVGTGESNSQRSVAYGDGVCRSDYGGATWQKLTGNGLPAGELGRIGPAIASTDANIVYTTIEATARFGGLYRSDDGGLYENWDKGANWI